MTMGSSTESFIKGFGLRTRSENSLAGGVFVYSTSYPKSWLGVPTWGFDTSAFTTMLGQCKMHQHAAKPHETPSEENPWETYAKGSKTGCI